MAKKVYESKSLKQMISDSHTFDEQLLEGLPVDDFGGKLFWTNFNMKLDDNA